MPPLRAVPPNERGPLIAHKGTLHSPALPQPLGGSCPEGAPFLVHTKEPRRPAAPALRGPYAKCFAEEFEWHPIGNRKLKGFYSEK